jgi:hypothetical protein
MLKFPRLDCFAKYSLLWLYGLYDEREERELWIHPVRLTLWAIWGWVRHPIIKRYVSIEKALIYAACALALIFALADSTGRLARFILLFDAAIATPLIAGGPVVVSLRI